MGLVVKKGSKARSITSRGMPVPVSATAETESLAAAPAQARYLQCAPFAREVSGIDLHGNANTWWGQAAGRYERGQRPEPGAVVCRMAPSFLRFGSWQLPASRGDTALLRGLTDYTLRHHFPELAAGTENCPRGCSHDEEHCALDAWVAEGHAGPSGAARLESLRRLLRSRLGTPEEE